MFSEFENYMVKPAVYFVQTIVTNGSHFFSEDFTSYEEACFCYKRALDFIQYFGGGTAVLWGNPQYDEPQILKKDSVLFL